jgi:hypothetical protein
MNYLRMAKLTEKKIRQYGTKAVLRIPAGKSVWDDDTATWIDAFETYPGVCLVTNYEQEDIDGTLIEVGDKRLLCVFPVEPKPKVHGKTLRTISCLHFWNCRPLPDPTVSGLISTDS